MRTRKVCEQLPFLPVFRFCRREFVIFSFLTRARRAVIVAPSPACGHPSPVRGRGDIRRGLSLRASLPETLPIFCRNCCRRYCRGRWAVETAPEGAARRKVRLRGLGL